MGGVLATRREPPAETNWCLRHAVPVRFTEHELTSALTGAAKVVLATRRKDVRRGRADIDTVWDEMDHYQRFQLLDRLGDQILPGCSHSPTPR